MRVAKNPDRSSDYILLTSQSPKKEHADQRIQDCLVVKKSIDMSIVKVVI